MYIHSTNIKFAEFVIPRLFDMASEQERSGGIHGSDPTEADATLVLTTKQTSVAKPSYVATSGGVVLTMSEWLKLY